MRLLLDQGVARSAELLLKASGLDATHVGTLGMQRSSDLDLIAFATSQNMVIVTRDADFSDWIATGGLRSPSVIRIRAEGVGAAEIALIIRNVVTGAGEALQAGALVSTDGRAVRIRMLPVGRDGSGQ